MSQAAPLISLGPRYGVASIYLALGAMLLCLGLIFPWLATSLWPALLLICLPCLCSGAVALLSGWGLVLARLRLDQEGLWLSLPAWRGFPCPPRRSWRLTWDQVQGLERHTVYFRTLLMLGPLPGLADLVVVVYTLRTSQGDITLLDKTLPGLSQAMALLAAHCALEIQEGPARQGNLLQTLLRGTLPAG